MGLRALAFVPTHNAPGKKDVTGAFLPEARRWCVIHGVDPHVGIVQFDNRASKKARRAEIHAALERHPYDRPLEHVAFFCHGLRNAIQTGHSSKRFGLHTMRTILELVDRLRYAAHFDLCVTLYCCDTGRDADTDKADDLKPGPGGDGGFADVLRDIMSGAGFEGGWVDAHTVTAHTTRAPYVRRFYTDGKPDGQNGGGYIVEPRSPLWGVWRKALWSKASPTDIRLRFPRLTVREVHSLLEGREIVG